MVLPRPDLHDLNILKKKDVIYGPSTFVYAYMCSFLAKTNIIIIIMIMIIKIIR